MAAMRRQKIPSFIFLVADSSNSLASMATLHTLDTDDSRPSSMRGVAPTFGKKGVDKALTSKAPRIPQRKTSMDINSFRRVPSSFEMDHQDSMRNATFDINSSLFQTSSNNEPSLFDRFGGCLETIQSPRLTRKKTRKSPLNSDEPLTLPRRKPSEQSCSLSPSNRNLLISRSPTNTRRYCDILSGLQNATFDDLMDTTCTTSCPQRRLAAAGGEARRISNSTL